MTERDDIGLRAALVILALAILILGATGAAVLWGDRQTTGTAPSAAPSTPSQITPTGPGEALGDNPGSGRGGSTWSALEDGADRIIVLDIAEGMKVSPASAQNEGFATPPNQGPVRAEWWAAVAIGADLAWQRTSAKEPGVDRPTIMVVLDWGEMGGNLHQCEYLLGNTADTYWEWMTFPRICTPKDADGVVYDLAA